MDLHRRASWGFAYENEQYESLGGIVSRRNLMFPIWLPIPLFIVLPALWGKRYLGQRRRARLGLCRKCGYDLRASTERCPECGLQMK